MLREEASFVELPTLDLVSFILLEEGEQLHLEGCDISQYYSRLEGPDGIILLLDLPRVSASSVTKQRASDFLVTCMTRIQIGAPLPSRLLWPSRPQSCMTRVYWS